MCITTFVSTHTGYISYCIAFRHLTLEIRKDTAEIRQILVIRRQNVSCILPLDCTLFCHILSVDGLVQRHIHHICPVPIRSFNTKHNIEEGLSKANRRLSNTKN